MEDQVVYNTTSVVYTQHSTIPPQWDILGQFHAKITGKSNHRKKNIVKREFFFKTGLLFYCTVPLSSM